MCVCLKITIILPLAVILQALSAKSKDVVKTHLEQNVIPLLARKVSSGG